MSIFTNNLKKLMKERGTTYAALSKELGISKNGLKYWETAGNIPNVRILQTIADYFGTTVEYLVGQSDKEIAPKPSEDELELLEIYRQLAKSGKRQLIGKAYELLDSQNNPQAEAEATPPDIDMVAPVLDRGVKK